MKGLKKSYGTGLPKINFKIENFVLSKTKGAREYRQIDLFFAKK